MKKVVTATASAVILAGVFAAPGIVGTYTKNRLDSLIDSLQTPEIQLSWESYKKGWFGAEAVLNTRMTIEVAADAEPVVLNVQSKVSITHGPVILNDGIQLGWAGWNSEIINTEELGASLGLSGQSVYRMDGHVNLLGTIKFSESIPALAFSNHEFKVEFNGYQSQGSLDGNHLDYRGRVESLTAEHIDIPVPASLTGLTVSVNGALPEGNELLPGDYSMTVDDLKIGDLFVADGLEIFASTELNEQASAADLTIRYSANRLQTPQTLLTDTELELSINNYSIAFNRAYTKALEELFYKHGDMALVGLEAPAIFEQHLDKLLASKPEIEVTKATFTLPEGTFSSRVNLKLANYDVSDVQLNSPVFLLENLNIDAYAEADKMLAEKMAAQVATGQMVDTVPEAIAQNMGDLMIEMLTAEKMIILQNDKYTANLSMTNGVTTANGQPLPLDL